MRILNFGEFIKIILKNQITLTAIMNVLHIEGVISSKAEAETMAPGEKVFSFEDLEAFLATNGEAPFEAIINSPGGSVEEGFRIYEKLKSLDVTTIAHTANSIASIIFLSGKSRKVTPKSQIIIHNAWVDAKDLEGEKLNVHTVKALTEFFAETDKKILDVYTGVAGSARTGKIFALMSQDTDLGASLALEFGFATEMAEKEYQTAGLKNRVLTFSRNQIALLNIQEGPIKTYADILYVNDSGQVLVVKRKSSDDFEPGKWGFVGGKVMQGETTKQGALREFKEETGLEILEAYLVEEVVNEDESLTVYFAAKGSELPVILPEHESAEFISVEEFSSYEFIKDQSERFETLLNKTITILKMQNEEKLNAFEKALAGLKNLFKLQARNMAVTTQEGVEIFIAGAEDGELVGKTVYLADESLPTETLAPAGVHVLEDGTRITLDESGVISEVVAPEPPEDVEALKAAYEEKEKAMEEEKAKLQAKIAAQAKTIEDQNKAIEESKTQISKLVKDFADLKNLIPGDPEKPKAKALSREEFAKLTPSEQIRLRAMNKAV